MRRDIIYGLATGAGMCLWTLLEFALGLHSTRIDIGAYSGYFATLVPFVALWLLLRKTQEEFGPLFDLRRGLAAGIVCAFVGAVVLYIFLVAYNLYINPAWLDYFLKWKVEQMRAAHLAETEIRRTITIYRNANTPIGLLVSSLLGTTLLGALMACFLTIWLRWRTRTAR